MKPVLAALAVANLVSLTHAQAETPLERGTCLMNSIVACGNCYARQDPDGLGPELAGGNPIEESCAFIARP
jgi:hypothetical protein